jgi:hypothetical protein
MTHRHLHIRPRYKRIFRVDHFDRAYGAVTAIGGKDRQRRIVRPNDPCCRMRRKDQFTETFRRNGSKSISGKRLDIRCVVAVQPSPFDPGDVGKPGQGSGIFVLFDESRKIPTIFEEKRRCRWRGAHMKARHGAEKIRSRQALHRRENPSEGIYQLTVTLLR